MYIGNHMVILFDRVYHLYLSMPLPIEAIYSNFKFNTETTWIMPMNLLKYPNFDRAEKYTLLKTLLLIVFFDFFKRNLNLKKVKLFIWDFLSVMNFTESSKVTIFGSSQFSSSHNNFAMKT